MELIDSKSDLFRYRFDNSFLAKYENKFLNVIDMLNKLIYCFNFLHKMSFDKFYDESSIDISTCKPSFFVFAPHGIGNCYLWESRWGDGCHKQVTGYSEVAKFLYKCYLKNKNENYFFPMCFSFRNAIELVLKRLLLLNTEVKLDQRTISKINNSHILKKYLWNNYKSIVEYYANEMGTDINTLDLIDIYLDQLETIDKNGDAFRYPFKKSFEFFFNDEEFNVDNVYEFFCGLINFFDGCYCMLEQAKEYEGEMRSYNCY